jgi:exodeoxyribonuclease VII small subunit
MAGACNEVIAPVESTFANIQLEGGNMAQLKFEEAMERLENIVQGLEEGELTLEQSLETFEEGMKLIKFCTQKLEEAEQKVTMLVQGSDGTLSKQPIKLEEDDES